MSKAGRKPINAERYPSGRVKPPPSSGNSRHDRRTGSRGNEAPPTAVRRMLDEAIRGAFDPRLGTGLGRLFAYGEIKAHQFAAAEEYAKLRGRFDRITHVPRRMAQSPCYGDARSSAKNPGPVSEAAYVATVTDHTKLLAHVGRWYPMLERACVDDNYVAEDEMRSIRIALDSLAVWFGLAKSAA